VAVARTALTEQAWPLARTALTEERSPVSGKTGRAVLGLVAAILAATLVLVGRATVHRSPEPGAAGPPARSQDYVDGLRAGAAAGRQEGRALQEGASLPADSRQPVQDAFNAGYAAGANDVFNDYDGGWAVSAPYAVTLATGSGQLTYRIATRVPFTKGIDYYLCPDGHEICQQSGR
jgi:hypothetical protein